MPYINIRIGHSLTSEQRSALQQQTTTLMHRVMGKRRAVTVVHLDESAAQQWSVDGTTLTDSQPVGAYVDIKITAGSNSAAQKEAMIAETVAMLHQIVGDTQQACYVVIDEIPGDSWGYDGVTQLNRAASDL